MVVDTSFMPEYKAKKMICEIGKRMYQRNYVAANDGNISVKTAKNRIVCTPTGVSKGFMTPDMLVVVDLDGNLISGSHKASSEIKMHLRVYKENENVRAVTHAHPLIATSYAIAGIDLDLALSPEAVVLLGKVPIAPYATPGSQEVPDSIAPYCKGHNAVLLANHGALTWGKDLTESYHRLESLEHYAGMLLYTTRLIGSYKALDCEQVDTLIELRKKMGITTGGVPQCNIVEEKGKDMKKQIDPLEKSISNEEEMDSKALNAVVDKVTYRILQTLERGGH